MKTKPVIAHLLFAIIIITPMAFAADNIRVVAMAGQQAPGFPTGVTFNLTIMAIDSPPRSMKNAVNQLFLTG